jgi:hypothetical protein
MKIKTTIAVLAASMLAISAFGQGQVTFVNTPTKPVVDNATGAPVELGTTLAGLYYTTDLGAVPSVNPPLDDWTLAATTPVTPNALFAGVYSGGTVTITGVPESTTVLLQVRAWSAAHADYAAAWGDPTAKVGASNVMQVSLGGGTIPVPSIGPLVEGFTMTPVPEPSTIALGLLGGLGAMLLLRRRK